MKYTLDYTKQLFESINFDLFDDKLDMPTFFILDAEMCQFIDKKDPYFVGICIPTNEGYCIGLHKELTYFEYFNTLVHELIHIYCMEKWDYSGHGKKFKKICEKAVDIYYPD